MGRRTKKNYNRRNLKTKEDKKNKKSIRLKDVLIAIVVILVSILALIKFNQVSIPSIAALVNDTEVENIIATESVNVDIKEENGFILTPNYKEPTKGIIIYGDKGVSPKAYVPLGFLLAKNGYLVAIPSFLLNSPSKDSKTVDNIIKDNPNVTVCAIVGHGEGGRAMSHFLADQEKIKGAVFLASYPDGNVDLSKTLLKVISISGTNDARLDKLLYESRKSRFPPNTMYVQIERGNYDHFANYTEDMEGILTKTEQQIQTAVQILNLIDRLR